MSAKKLGRIAGFVIALGAALGIGIATANASEAPAKKPAPAITEVAPNKADVIWN